MRVRLSCLVLAMFLVPALAHADGHKADLYAGFSFGDGGSKISGFHQSLAWSLPSPKDSPSPKAHWLTLVIPDVSVQFGGHNGKDLTQVAYLFGARVSLTSRYSRHKVFAQGLYGGVYTNDGTVDAGSNQAGASGAGYETFFHDRTEAAKKIGDPHLGLGFRVQIDYVFRSERESFTRASAGFVYRFAKHRPGTK
jgi:hypothetical protein